MAPATSPRATPAHRHAAAVPVVVYVAGAVRRPGLYRLRAGARADDALRAAGGFRPDADTAAVNLAAHVDDGDEVRVAALGEPTPRVRSTARSRRAGKTASPPPVVDLNGAGTAQLSRIPGIGAAIAQRIVDVRDRDGPYETLDQLLDVAGMTAARLNRASPYLRL